MFRCPAPIPSGVDQLHDIEASLIADLFAFKVDYGLLCMFRFWINCQLTEGAFFKDGQWETLVRTCRYYWMVEFNELC